MTKWFIKNNDIDFKRYIDELNIHPVIAKILANREIKDLEDVESFLYGDLKSMHSPDLMLGVKEAGQLIKKNIDYNKTIRVVGDYDVDGIISTYILTTVINDLGGIVDYHIPNRVDDGYGINKEIIKKAYDDNVSLIITCDNGIQALKEVDYAKELGIDIIITDHHDLSFIEKNGERQYVLPNANAVVNPKNSNCEYPFKNLYSIGYLISFIVDTPVENLKSKIENFNPSTGSYYKRFGEYKATALQQSKSMEDFENNLKTIQVPEYNLTIMANYETNSPKSSLIYQCKMVAYTNEDITTITNKANK